MNASSVKITRLTAHQVNALEAGYAAGYIKAAITKTTADWFNGITPSHALAQVKNFQAELKAQHGARGGHYQALHAVANKLVKLMETGPMPADAITFADEAPVKATTPKLTFVEVTMGVSAGGLELFRKLAKDAGNWSGTPLLPLISPVEKAAFTNLKKRGLMGSFVDNGCVFATFTKAGANMANELYGIEIETTY